MLVSETAIESSSSDLIWSLENRINYAPSLRSPHDILFLSDEELLVTDAGVWPHSSGLKHFKRNNNLRPIFTYFSDSDSCLLPFGLLKLENGSFLVTDHASRSVVKCDLNEKVIDFNWVAEDVNFSWPLGISKSDDRIFVADSEKNAIVILDMNGNFISVLKSPNLKRPEYVVEMNNFLYVSDSKTRQIEIFDLHTETHLDSIGKGIISFPKGLGNRNDKQLIVADQSGNKIISVTVNGSEVFNYTVLANISHPKGISVNDDLIACTQQKYKFNSALKLIKIKT